MSAGAAVVVDDDALRFGDHLTVSFQRTLRVPATGGPYPLPPTLGRFPVRPAAGLAGLPEPPPGVLAVVVPVYRREALWLALAADSRAPVAVKVGVGGICAVSGRPWDRRFGADPQDYVVCPPQVWIDGLNTGDGEVSQFVCEPLGRGRTAEARLTGAEAVGGLQLLVSEPRAAPAGAGEADGDELPAGAMGVGAGGRVAQRIYPDPHGAATWEGLGRAEAFVHLLDSRRYRSVTGEEPPPTPVDLESYLRSGLPWFEVYDDDELGDVGPPARLRSLGRGGGAGRAEEEDR